MFLFLLVLKLLVIGLIIGGLVFRILANCHLTEYGSSIKWYNYKFWFLGQSSTSDRYTPSGLRYLKVSTWLILIGIVGGFILESIN